MSAALAEAVERLNLKPGQSVREVVNGHVAELRLFDDEPTPELAEQLMMMPWWEPPFDPIATIVATPGPGWLPDPPIIPPDDELES